MVERPQATWGELPNLNVSSESSRLLSVPEVSKIPGAAGL